MEKKEAEFCTKLGKWWDYEGHKFFYPKGLVLEAKVSIGKEPLNYKSKFRPHQIPTMIAYSQRPMHWKISDLDTISTKHYDISCTQPSSLISAFAIMWIRPRNKIFWLIDPNVLSQEIVHGSKSLTEDRAKQLAFYEGEIK